MDFRVLGTLEVWSDAGRIMLPSSRHQRVLAALLLAPNSVVPNARLVSALWDAEPPMTATKQVQNCISVLRDRLGGGNDVIVTDGPGYRVVVTDAELDASRFCVRLNNAKRQAADGHFRAAVGSAREALRLWRGPALDGLDSIALAGSVARLNEQRINAIELCADWQLELGDYHAVIEELTDLVAQHPLREGAHARLMVALDRGDRQADALAVFHTVRTRLVDELGVEPGPELHEVYARILDAKPSAPAAASSPATDSRAAQVDHAARHLAVAVTRQWTAEAQIRSLHRPEPIAVTWSDTTRPVSAVAAAPGSCPGKSRSDQQHSRGTLTDIVAMFRGTPHQQLVVLGEPGAGKTVLAMVLTLGLLAERQPDEPVPVLLPLTSWNPHQQHLHQWLTTKLRDEYPGLASAASTDRTPAPAWY